MYSELIPTTSFHVYGLVNRLWRLFVMQKLKTNAINFGVLSLNGFIAQCLPVHLRTPF